MVFPSSCAILESWNDEIPDSKHQITNKFQIFTLWNPAFGRFAKGEIPQGKYSMTKTENRIAISNFGHCDLFDICDLEFLILQYSKGARHVCRQFN